MAETIKITELFGANLAALLADKITSVYPRFDSRAFIKAVAARVEDMNYTRRIEIIAEELRNFLPAGYLDALGVLMQILGPENPHETGMFTNYYWLMPVGKFVQLYGLDHFDESMDAIAEITKRNTGEYAIRPYIRRHPDRALRRMNEWARSDNFHLRRLASEGLRPKLPWAPKLDTFVTDPDPVFAILELLKEDPSKFVQKSVANHLTDYLKVNPEPTRKLIGRWRQSNNAATQWIVRHATRKVW
ncbi:DNA alkylation repair protein [Streptomyces caniscabiei]|uniref:DNA alkylation repair protein n=1 Tax=Streptomyces caniscabiei TaxID=2746961 RepID=UPI0029B49D6F|nr:DNA alkylation repair protein [Streptomyces caniscabiei]MDX2776638.1 DNA alkylation repair protein [Streptomyces caniscabiei]